MVIAEHNFWSFMEETAATFGVVLVASVPLVLLILRNHKQGERTYRHLNGLEEVAVVPDGDDDDHPTLGRVVKEIQLEMRNGFIRNDETHEEMKQVIQAQGETIHDHGQRIDALRREMNLHHPGST